MIKAHNANRYGYKPPATEREHQSGFRASLYRSLIERKEAPSLPGGLGYVVNVARKRHFSNKAARDLDESNRQILLQLLHKAGFRQSRRLISNARMYRAMVRGHNPAETTLLKLIEKNQDRFRKQTDDHIILEFGCAGGEVTEAVLKRAGKIHSYYAIDIAQFFLDTTKKRLEEKGINVGGMFRGDFTNPHFLKYCFDKIKSEHPDIPIHIFIFGYTFGNYSENDPFEAEIANILYNIGDNMRQADPALGMQSDKLTMNVAHRQSLEDLNRKYRHTSTDYFLFSELYAACQLLGISGLDLSGFEMDIDIPTGAGVYRHLVCTKTQIWNVPIFSKFGERIGLKTIPTVIEKGQKIRCFPSEKPSHKAMQTTFNKARVIACNAAYSAKADEHLYTYKRRNSHSLSHRRLSRLG